MTEPGVIPVAITRTAVAGQQQHEQVFPLAYAVSGGSVTLEETLRWLRQHRQELLDSLARHGAILFRGLPVATDQEFDRCVQAFDLPGFTYAESLSNAVRRNRTARVFTANEAPPSVEIYLHHEMAQTPLYPSRLFFFCEHAASAGGATPLCRSDRLLSALELAQPDFVAACAARGVRYANVMPATEDLESGQGRSWRQTLNADTPAAAEAKLRSLGYDWEWLPDESLRATTPVLPAVRELADGRRVFFNQLLAAFRGWQDKRNTAAKTICFGDGSAIPASAMDCASALAEEMTFDLQWHTGDFALVDNFLVMHGRRPYSGERRVLAALVA